MKRLPREKRRLIGIFRMRREKGGGVIDPGRPQGIESQWPIAARRRGWRQGPAIWCATISPARGRFARAAGTRGGDAGQPHTTQRQISLIAVHAHGIPDEFPDRVLAGSSTKLSAPSSSPRSRRPAQPLTLLTIDPVDARDHDDAVHAAPDPDPEEPRMAGWCMWRSPTSRYYVRPGHPASTTRRSIRGNSVYFPDRVVPMLPERISNDLCSLREKRVTGPASWRAWSSTRHGSKRSHTFLRAMMRSAAKLSYEEAQAAIDGKPSAQGSTPARQRACKPLWAAYAVLWPPHAIAANRLNLDLPERQDREARRQGPQVERIYRARSGWRRIASSKNS